MSTQRYRVWDLPTRFFHWSIVALVVAQYLSGEFHLLSMRWHYLLGYALLGLVVFRLIWGIVGAQTSRFSQFVRGPVTVARYAVASLRGTATHSVGHNPLGGWSVVVLLTLLALQAGSGLWTTDDVTESGPLVDAAGASWVRLASSIHAWTRYALALFVVLHVVAVVLHRVRGGEDLVGPMLHGEKALPADPQLKFAPVWVAVLAAVVAAGVVVAVLVWA